MRSRMPPEYEIPDDPDNGRMDAAYLRSCLGLRATNGELPPPFPVAVRRAHYDMARSLSLLGVGGPMDATQLATVVALAWRDPEMTFTQPKEEEPEYSFMPEVEDGTLDIQGKKVVVHWRKKDHAGHFLGLDDDRIVVLLAGKELRFRPDLVRWPKEGEFPEVADNINQPSEA